MAAIHEILHDDAATTVVVTHGGLLSLILKHFDERIGFAEWQKLSNPDVYLLTQEQDCCRFTRVWQEKNR